MNKEERKKLKDQLQALQLDYEYHNQTCYDIMKEIEEIQDILDEEDEPIEEYEEYDEDED